MLHGNKLLGLGVGNGFRNAMTYLVSAALLATSANINLPSKGPILKER